MNADSSLHQNNLVCNLILRCALPVLLFAIFAIFILYWTDQALACFLATLGFICKWVVAFFEFITPMVISIKESAAWKFFVDFILLPLKPIALPLFLALVCGTLICGCALNKLKLRGIADQRYEKLVSIWKALSWIALAPMAIGILAEVNFEQSAESVLFKIVIWWIGCIVMAVHLYRVEKVNGDLFKKGRLIQPQ
jgi:hypothetical protein